MWMYTFEKVHQSVHFRERLLIDTLLGTAYIVHEFQHANVHFPQNCENKHDLCYITSRILYVLCGIR